MLARLIDHASGPDVRPALDSDLLFAWCAWLVACYPGRQWAL